MSGKPGVKGAAGGGKGKKPAKGGAEEKTEDALQAVVCDLSACPRTYAKHFLLASSLIIHQTILIDHSRLFPTSIQAVHSRKTASMSSVYPSSCYDDTPC